MSREIPLSDVRLSFAAESGELSRFFGMTSQRQHQLPADHQPAWMRFCDSPNPAPTRTVRIVPHHLPRRGGPTSRLAS
jgi:hypothetical protein